MISDHKYLDSGYASLPSHHGSHAILARVRFFAQKAQIEDRTACSSSSLLTIWVQTNISFNIQSHMT